MRNCNPFIVAASLIVGACSVEPGDDPAITPATMTIPTRLFVPERDGLTARFPFAPGTRIIGASVTLSCAGYVSLCIGTSSALACSGQRSCADAVGPVLRVRDLVTVEGDTVVVRVGAKSNDAHGVLAFESPADDL